MTGRRHLAIDLGASSGRVIEVAVDPDAATPIETIERHRFPNGPVGAAEHGERRLVWPWTRIVFEVKSGLRAAAGAGGRIVDSIAIDSWAVDYGLLDDRGELVAPVAAYRDPRTASAFERVRAKLGEEAIHDATGIQFQPFNTIYQLAADAADPSRPLDRARRLLMIPDLVAHELCGSDRGERTNASSTQMLDGDGRWIEAFVRAVGVDPEVLPTLADAGAGEPLGVLRREIAAETGLSVTTPVLATATHDTASAIAAAPIDPDGDCYISSGTWSLIGMERTAPVLGDAARRANLTNEHGAFGTVRTLMNMAGLWLLEESRRAIAAAGRSSSLEDLLAAADAEPPWRTVFDPDDPRFAQPGDMPARIRQACRERGESVPEDDGSLVRAILDSLALATAAAVDRLAALTRVRPQRLVVVGGGSLNDRLNRSIAEASGVPVETGPVEATAIGNALLQFASLEGVRTLGPLRELVRRSFPSRRFESGAATPACTAAAGRLRDAGTRT